MPRQPAFDSSTYDRFLRFVELDEFRDDWIELGLDDERDLWDLQERIMAAPAAPVIPGTGGLRKLRFSPARWTTGKRGAVRVCYAVFPRFRVVLLVRAYGKAKQENLTAREQQGIKTFLAQIESWLERVTKIDERN